MPSFQLPDPLGSSRAMYTRQGLCQVGLQVRIGSLGGYGPSDDDIVEAGARGAQELPDRCFEPPPHPVADDGFADLLAHGEAEPGAFCFRAATFRADLRPRLCLEHQGGGRPSEAASDSEKLRSALECRQPHGLLLPVAGSAAASRGRRPLPSGREALAALRSPARNNLCPAGCHHALPEAMAALANKATRLVGAFHVLSPYRSRSLGWPSGEGPNGSTRARHPSGHGSTCSRDREFDRVLIGAGRRQVN